jgi:hypothetical protein
MTKREKLLIDLELIEEKMLRMEQIHYCSNLAEVDGSFWPKVEALVVRKVAIEILLETAG